MTAEEYRKIQARVEALQRKKDQAEGAMQETLKELKAKFGVSSLREADSLVDKLRARKAKLEKRLEQAEAKFKEKWQEVLDELEG